MEGYSRSLTSSNPVSGAKFRFADDPGVIDAVGDVVLGILMVYPKQEDFNRFADLCRSSSSIPYPRQMALR